MNMYLDMVNTTGGAIAWAFLKPMLMGHILFTPDTPVTRAIMEKVCRYSKCNSGFLAQSELAPLGYYLHMFNQVPLTACTVMTFVYIIRIPLKPTVRLCHAHAVIYNFWVSSAY